MSSVASKSLQLPSGYQEFLQELKGRIRTAQVRAAFAVNRELVLLYWSIGRDLSQRLDKEDWGGKIVDRLSRDLQAEFPGVEGFSPLNRSPSRLEFSEALLGSIGVTERSQQEIDSGTLGIDGPIQVAPATLHAKVGFVPSPGLVGRLEMPSQSLLHRHRDRAPPAAPQHRAARENSEDTTGPHRV